MPAYEWDLIFRIRGTRDDRGTQRRVSVIQRWWAYVNKKSSQSAACLELFIETDYCATNAALRNAYGGTLYVPALSVTRLYTKGHTFLAPSCFFVLRSLYLWVVGKKHTPRTVEDAKSNSARFFESDEARCVSGFFSFTRNHFMIL